MPWGHAKADLMLSSEPTLHLHVPPQTPGGWSMQRQGPQKSEGVNDWQSKLGMACYASTLGG